jgi:leucyl aminopeptidase
VTQAKPGEEPAQIARLSLVTPQRAPTQKIIADAEALATGICFARDQVNEPPSTLWPDAFAKRLVALKKHGIAVEVHDEGALRKMGAGGILAVAQGSQHPPRLVVLRWNGKGGKQKGGPVALVGKGVCFDSGGLSLKRTSQMLTMKGDMGGAAAVAGAILAAALRKAKVDVVGVMALVENMPSGSSYRPGDIVKTLAGKTMEIVDTDAEGRVTLVDSLYYAASKLNPCCVLDAATLTYSVTAALGPVYAGLFATDEALARETLAAGEAAGEELWRLPVNAEYVKNLKSKIADYRQCAPDDASADAAHAAALMGEFVNGKPWAHLDIANKEFAGRDSAICPEGATGYGVALFDAFLRQRE